MKQLQLRDFLIGIFGLVIITASSMYVALRMGALPWPTVFVTVVSMGILAKFRDTTIQEINITHTMMSSGSMVAGALAFTIPGLWILDSSAKVSFKSVMVMTVAGAVLGTLFSAVFRKYLVEDDSIAFPIGKAAYNTLVTGLEKKKESLKLFVSMGISVLFTTLRDFFGFIPSAFEFFRGSSFVAPLSIWVSPMALAIGAIIGKTGSFMWLSGAVLGYLVITPIGISAGFFKDIAASDLFRQNLGIGVMLGTGLGILIKTSFDIAKNIKKEKIASSKKVLSCAAIIAVVSCVVTIGTELSFIQSILAVAGICIVTLLSGLLTGQSGVNPMEVFGILVMLAVSLIVKTDLSSKFIIAGLAAVSCGLCGDVMNDLKSGYMLKTDSKTQLFAEGIGGVIGAVISVFALFAMKDAFGGFGTAELPAPQAAGVATLANGLGNTKVLVAGVVIGCIFYLAGLPASTAGLGLYLSSSISFAVGLGALISTAIRKAGKASENDISLVSSGLLGGEGISGVVVAIIRMFAKV